MQQFSHSRVETFNQCPYKFFLRYKRQLEMLDPFEADDPFKVGTALHEGIQQDARTAIKNYYMSYPVITNAHVNESIKLEIMIKKAREILPLENSQFEVELMCNEFKGYIDMLTPLDNGHYDIYDFKYTNNSARYNDSPQLSIYKYYAEKLLHIKIDHLYFVFVGKTSIRQKKTENLTQFRARLIETCNSLKVTVKEVPFKFEHILSFFESEISILNNPIYNKNQTDYCKWCEYNPYCLENKEDFRMLPSTNRVPVETVSYKKIWIYGPSFSGKTTMLDAAPTPLNLNTDGNVKYVTMARLPIQDEVRKVGRTTRRTFAWEVFKEAVEELETGSEFETIIVDLIENVYEDCRVYMYDKLGIEHESDDPFKAWDKVRNEFLTVMKRVLVLPYNIVLVSHDDTSKDIMKRGGDKVTSIGPAIPEKVAKVLAGMVDIVARVVVNGSERTLNFKSDEVIFGGGRLQGIDVTSIPLSWAELEKVYDSAIKATQKQTAKTLTAHQQKVEDFKKSTTATPRMTKQQAVAAIEEIEKDTEPEQANEPEQDGELDFEEIPVPEDDLPFEVCAPTTVEPNSGEIIEPVPTAAPVRQRRQRKVRGEQ